MRILNFDEFVAMYEPKPAFEGKEHNGLLFNPTGTDALHVEAVADIFPENVWSKIVYADQILIIPGFTRIGILGYFITTHKAEAYEISVRAPEPEGVTA